MRVWVKVIGSFSKNKYEKEIGTFVPPSNHSLKDLQQHKLLSSDTSSIWCLRHPDCLYEGLVREDDWKFYDFKRLHDTLCELSKDVVCPSKNITEAKWKEGAEACTFYSKYDPSPCPLLQHYFPLYLFAAPSALGDFGHSGNIEYVWWVVHPDERERMERILNGTDNPLYDLVHELRYNPNISSKLGGAERLEAEEDFKKRKLE